MANTIRFDLDARTYAFLAWIAESSGKGIDGVAEGFLRRGIATVSKEMLDLLGDLHEQHAPVGPPPGGEDQ